MKSDREKYRNMTAKERKELVEKIFIMHPSFENCYNIINECYEHSKISVEPLCAVMLGKPGSGKTTLCTKIEETYPRIELEEKTKIPALVASIPVPLTTRNMVTALLVALGDPLADRGTTFSKTIRLFKQLKECEVEIIILDEFHHIIDKDSDKVLHIVSDWLKQLINEVRIPLIFVGLPHSIKILKANNQLERRFSLRGELINFNWKSKPKKESAREEQAESTNNHKFDADNYRIFIKILDESLPLLETSRLAAKSISYRLWKATEGNVNRTMKLVRYAAKLAIENKEERVTLPLLEIAYEKIFPYDEIQNPFKTQ